MKKIRLSELELTKIIKRVLEEQSSSGIPSCRDLANAPDDAPLGSGSSINFGNAKVELQFPLGAPSHRTAIIKLNGKPYCEVN